MKEIDIGDPLGLLNSPYPIREGKLWSLSTSFAELYCQDQDSRCYSPQAAVHHMLPSKCVICIPLTWPEAMKHIIFTMVEYYSNLGVCEPKCDIK